MTVSLMLLGTGSDVGKSIAVTAFCRILKRRGLKVAPFKAQNMSNNSFVTVEGGEIGRAQVVQAEAAGLLPSVHMNPILLKPSSGQAAQIILQGKVASQMDAMGYHEIKPRLVEVVMDSYTRLSKNYDVIVMEGAGSCCEMNLKHNDLVNFQMAKAARASCILVADIDRGGVLAQIIGTMELMTKEERDMTIGFLINKFRGDPRLFDSGIEYTEKKTGKPVLGLVPFYHDILIDPEDSVAVQEDRRGIKPVTSNTVNIGVVRLPAISNFTDLEILEREPDVVVNYLSRPSQLDDGYDCLVIPGTKNVMEDADWLRKRGWRKTIYQFLSQGRIVMGICGGYQLLGQTIKDPYEIESKRAEVKGLGVLPLQTVLEREKIVREVRGICLANGKHIVGYEIHMGRTRPMTNSGEPYLRIHGVNRRNWWNDGWIREDRQVMGTYVHGIFDAPGFRADFLNRIRVSKGLKQRPARRGRLVRFREYDKLADHFEGYCDVERILEVMSELK